ncbi:hypothetical protein TNCV_1791881 [Trichonephila clavipes]|nr:hypothetical protein TNCV_1791881 [Trichonephila clavipes]
MSASRTDVASSVEVSDLFLSCETMSFDVMAATDLIDNCTTCAESGLCGVLDEILFTLEDVDAEAQITPEDLGCRKRSLKTPARIAAERRSVEGERREIGRLPRIRLPSPYRDSSSGGGRGIVSRRELGRDRFQLSQLSFGDRAKQPRRRKPPRALALPDQGRFENGKLESSNFAEEHRIIQKFVSDKKCGRIHSDGPQVSVGPLNNHPPCPHSAIDVRNSFITLSFALEHRSV